ncbi:SDR family oxidoreductase [Clostridium sp. SYSU_GA19001]|uniref:SDR family oxidoreductase n=1 Tax=Clostridium caldaquaticum TaxID=2940653 RepID=UPI00207720F8|nr:SDR family oxidoreductase [Clostridium caldaquaticum]MCM8711152.1 SDR family oxidoreductase [Clostridium caldaquaticum]
MNNNLKVVLITGASSGIGQAIANTLMEKGYRVYGTSRNIKEENIIKAKSGSGFLKMIPLDVRSDESVKAAVEYILQKEITIDILINNAGFGIAGSVEDTSPEEALSQFDTNFFGVLRMCRAVLPKMREQKQGLIINISSVAGLISIPFQSMYCASKYALEAMTEALRIEAKPFGIKVSLVEPGDTKTGFTQMRQYTAASYNSAYNLAFLKSIKKMEKDEQNGPTPKLIVDAVLKIMNSKNPPIRIVAGFSYKTLVFLKRILPSRFVEFVVSRIYS